MSRKKGILFFDIDGTIFDDSRNLPDSVLPALEENAASAMRVKVKRNFFIITYNGNRRPPRQ